MHTVYAFYISKNAYAEKKTKDSYSIDKSILQLDAFDDNKTSTFYSLFKVDRLFIYFDAHPLDIVVFKIGFA